MGRDYVHKPENQSVRETLEEWYFGKGTILAIEFINPYVAFAAVYSTETQKISAEVCLLDWDEESEHNFGFKILPETALPVDTRCPESILNMLSPTTDPIALKWRADCWRRIQEKNELT